MLFSLSRGSYAPKYLGTLSGNGTAVGAILTSGACILLAASASMITQLAYNYLFGIAIFGAIIVWMTILVSHLSFRRRHDVSNLPVRMPFFPYLQIAGLVPLGAILPPMAYDTEFWTVSWIVGVPWLVLIPFAYFVGKTMGRERERA